MKKLVLMLGVILMCSSAFGTEYRVGSQGCADFEEAERLYIEEMNKPDPHVGLGF